MANKVRIKGTGKIIEVNNHLYNDPRKLRWMNAEKIEEPAKPKPIVQKEIPTQEVKAESSPSVENSEKIEEPAGGFEKSLEDHNIKELRNMAKGLEDYKSTLNKAELIELIQKS